MSEKRNKKIIEKQRQVFFLENSFVSTDDSFVRKKKNISSISSYHSKWGGEILLQRILQRYNECFLSFSGRLSDKGISLSAGHCVENGFNESWRSTTSDRWPTVETDPLRSTPPFSTLFRETMHDEQHVNSELPLISHLEMKSKIYVYRDILAIFIFSESLPIGDLI